MHVANLELCKELYELSGWEGDDRWYMTNPDGQVIGTATPRILRLDRDYQNGYRTDTPAYPVGYLLRKLPHKALRGVLVVAACNSVEWSAQYYSWYPEERGAKSPVFTADSAENATVQLAVHMFKQGILTRES